MRNVERSVDLDAQAAAAPNTWAHKPVFDVILDMRVGSPGAADGTIRSIARQSYQNSNLKIISSREPATAPGPKSYATWQDALSDGPADFVVPVRAGDQLAPWALFRLAEALQCQPSAAVIYGDEDQVDELGRRRSPWFKPRWNEELFLANDYLSRTCAIRASLVQRAAQDLRLEPEIASLELLLHAIERDRGPVVHVPHIITHMREPRRAAGQAHIDAVARHVAVKEGMAAAGPHGSVRITWPLPSDRPLVSIIVPTKDKVELLEACVGTVLARTSYAPFELLIVDNASMERRTIDYFDRICSEPRVRLLSYAHPYNYSAINNFAARHTRGSYLCLLNNDTEVVEPDWLTEMMRYAVRSEIGAVGAKLLYSDGTIQHAGVVVGIGDAAGHAHRNLRANDKGYFCQAHVPHFVSAVTGACLVVDKRKFLAVGGLDERGLPIAFNDVDLCLKLERSGWRNVYVPHAVLIHHESKSREKDHRPNQINRYNRELRVFQKRWRSETYDDPLLNPNLDRSSETFVIRF